jgi:protein involved in polysaccharide export with SLBB domain
MEVTQQLTGDDPQPMVHIPLPGWVWNLERRKQWQSALHEWRQIENIVILVELPPASEPEAVLLAQNLPNLIWLSDTGVVHAGPTREHLQTLRDARCNLVGSVVNHAPKAAVKDRFSRWTSCLALFLIAGGTLCAAEPQPQAQAQQPPPPRTITVTPVAPQAQPTPAIATNLAFSAYNSQRRAGWQQRFTLGPGDILNFALFGQPEFSRTEVPIGPDGRISYLQAQDIMAAGLTIDELRAKLDQELGKFYRTPRTIITPVAYNSKKYFILGKVVNAGAFSLDHPTSVVEAVARAHGLQTGILDSQNTIDIVDLQKSFLAREGKRIPVDLEKLFQHGDLSQNVALEPNDYLYFAPGVLKEVYVLGEIRVPGPVVHTENLTVVGAISSRGGFTDRAYKSRVLVVRGSLTAPQTFVVDTLATVDARGLDFRLQPKDIVYISWRPFIKAEELLDLAATAFIQSAIAAWSGQNIGPFITSPILPSL